MSERLYNGIRLTASWPPKDISQQCDEPMRVPYLENPPEIIPIDVGRQLFIDNFLVEETSLERIFHKPARYKHNPVLRPETPDELRFPSIGFQQGGVFYNPAKGVFEMFYHSNEQASRCRHIAISADMLNWTRIDTGLGAGNMFREPGPAFQGLDLRDGGHVFAVWLDLDAVHPVERYKLLSLAKYAHAKPPPGGMSHSLHTSPDGIHWSAAVPAGKADDAQSFFYNPFRHVWVYSIKRSLKRNGKNLRARWYAESRDFLKGGNWDNAVYWTCADRLDIPEPHNGYPAYPVQGDVCQLYTLHGVAYESIMLGMHEIHRGPHNSTCEQGRFPKLTDLEMGFSRDGFHWHRPDRSGFIRAARKPGHWDRGYLHSTTSICVIHEDRLFFPYAGFSGADPDGANPGMYRGGAIGVAMLRRDGFASLRAGSAEQTLTTRPVTFTGEYLFVNVDNPRGALAVEVLDDQGGRLPGFTRTDCLSVSADDTKSRVLWKDGASLKRFADRPVRFRFHLTQGDLYAFWVSRSLKGESGGYVAGGGPSFSGLRDV
ncbi:MAG: glycosyl hydrolase family 32 [Kiritimatiellia bacterium]